MSKKLFFAYKKVKYLIKLFSCHFFFFRGPDDGCYFTLGQPGMFYFKAVSKPAHFAFQSDACNKPICQKAGSLQAETLP